MERQVRPELPSEKESFEDLISSAAWSLLIKLAKEQVKPFKRALLMAHNLPIEERGASVGRLSALYTLIVGCYQKANEPVPESITEFFTS